MKKALNLLLLICFITSIPLINGCKKKPEIPTVTTTAVTAITVNTATSGGNVTADGGDEVTARGVCWGTATNPTVSGSHTTDGTGVGSFTSSITGLTPNTTYYVRAYATNSVGTAYGNEVTFTSSPIVLATLTTAAVTSVTSTTAVSGGNITADGGGAITARGVCWNTSTNPTIANNKTTDGTGTGTFVSNLASLSPGTTYYVKAYATNSAGTAYGNEVTFTTTSVNPTVTTAAVTNITSTTATSGGNITSDGGSPITVRGVCWATTQNPTAAGSHTTDGTGTGSFTSNITGLSPNTLYYVRAYATNAIGTAYGNEVSFTTAAVIPTLTTTAVSAITRTTATSGGNITSDGGSPVTARGVCWSTTANPTTANSFTTNGTGIGSFTSNLTGLTPNTTYYVRAYATNSVGTAYGNQVSFTTSPIVVATLTTNAVTSITATSAVSGGNITDNGGGTITARGVCWSTSANPTTADSYTSNGTGTGSFTSNITGLTTHTTYYVRAYATNEAGTAYGNQVSFTTVLADVEGNVYTTVTIGAKVWMVENLKTTKYNDNTAIPLVTVAADWIALTTPGYCWYNNDINNKTPYGALYNWYTVNTGKLCPAGWHVPSHDEFKLLETTLGMTQEQADDYGWRGTDEGTKLKNTTGWNEGQNGTNTSGFSALPGGFRYVVDGSFFNMGTLGYWWTSTDNTATDALYRRLDGDKTQVYAQGVLKTAGKSIRCVKD